MDNTLRAADTFAVEGTSFAVATVVSTFASAPRLPGSSMLVTPGGRVVGSVSGGCVDGAVLTACQVSMDTGSASLETFGVDDEAAFSIGLSCGGSIDVFVEPPSADLSEVMVSLAEQVERKTPVVLATVIDVDNGTYSGLHGLYGLDGAMRPTGVDRLDDLVLMDVPKTLREAEAVVRTYDMTDTDGDHQSIRVLLSPYVGPPRLLLFGSNDFSAALTRVGKHLGYHVTLVDARPVFTTPERYPEADEVVVQWPHRYLEDQLAKNLIDERSMLCVFTHDMKFDIPLLSLALRNPRIGYIGAMGSRSTHQRRTEMLQEAGVSDKELAKLHSPIGLDLGGRTPEQASISIAAEMIAHFNGGAYGPLRDTDNPIHRPSEQLK